MCDVCVSCVCGAHVSVCMCVCVLPGQIYIGAALPELAFKPDSVYIPSLEGEGGGLCACVRVCLFVSCVCVHL